MSRALAVAVAVTLAHSGVRAADWPKPTPEGERARDELVRACVGEVALLLGRPPTSMGDLAVRADLGSFRLAVASCPKLPAAALRDALAGWRVAGNIPALAAALL